MPVVRTPTNIKTKVLPIYPWGWVWPKQPPGASTFQHRATAHHRTADVPVGDIRHQLLHKQVPRHNQGWGCRRTFIYTRLFLEGWGMCAYVPFFFWCILLTKEKNKQYCFRKGNGKGKWCGISATEEHWQPPAQSSDGHRVPQNPGPHPPIALGAVQEDAGHAVCAQLEGVHPWGRGCVRWPTPMSIPVSAGAHC